MELINRVLKTYPEDFTPHVVQLQNFATIQLFNNITIQQYNNTGIQPA
jgi:hypothetical protein